jgi:hypothetical protein
LLPDLEANNAGVDDDVAAVAFFPEAANPVQAVERPKAVPPFVLIARFLQSVVPKRMRLVAKLLITPRADAVWNGMVVLAGEAGGVIAADVAAVAPDTEPVDGRLYPPD